MKNFGDVRAALNIYKEKMRKNIDLGKTRAHLGIQLE